jgi:radical SAM superfamily enzyme YgiQ (UPF0313 family)
MANIVLSTLNSTYQHAAFGLRYLYANMGELQSQTSLLEFTIKQNTSDIVSAVLRENPKVVGFGVYIWNTEETYYVVSALKKLRPELILVLGGPEISFETESQKLTSLADYVIQGEGDFLFPELCQKVFNDTLPTEKTISAKLPEIKSIKTPYELYTDEDIRTRNIYVEASRGCPYKCEYCLSSLDKSVRNFPLDDFLASMQKLIDRGARNFKFIDRTFNLSPSISTAILKFFLERSELGLFLHFEMVPDRLPIEIRQLIQQFPAGQIQFEIGIQTLNPTVASLVSRKNDLEKVRENFQFLVHETGVHIHADLIAGLPGEDLESFARGFDELFEMGPHEIQVGILKRLKGTPITRHDQAWKMLYSDEPPFQILATKTMSFEDLLRMQRFSRFWDKIGNSGQFSNVLSLLRKKASEEKESLFWSFMALSDFLFEKTKETHSVSLLNLFLLVKSHLIENLKLNETLVTAVLSQDYGLNGTREIPKALLGVATAKAQNLSTASVSLRQKTHMKGQSSPITQTFS